MLIDQNGVKQGIVSIDDALNTAKQLELDLVQVSPSDASPESRPLTRRCSA